MNDTAGTRMAPVRAASDDHAQTGEQGQLDKDRLITEIADRIGTLGVEMADIAGNVEDVTGRVTEQAHKFKALDETAKAMIDGNDMWWSVKGRAGNIAIIDHPWTEANGGRATVEVRKESLPPYAAMAVIIAALVAIVMTLIETYAPKAFWRWLPSISGIGLGFVIAGSDSIAMLIGALIAWVLEKAWPKKAEDYTLTVGSGVMAGASISGIGVILWSTFGGAILAALHLAK